jgi:hypothetical protein
LEARAHPSYMKMPRKSNSDHMHEKIVTIEISIDDCTGTIYDSVPINNPRLNTMEDFT